MSDNNSFKKKVRRHQKATGDSYMRARRQVDENSDATTASAIPEQPAVAKMCSLLGLGSATAPEITALWRDRELQPGAGGYASSLAALLRVPLGLQAGGQPVWLDLKELAAGGDGPHGLLIGASGTGKSVLLQTILFALCAQHSPELLQLVLIGARSSSTFAEFAIYPHTVAFPAGTDPKAALLDLIVQRTEALRAADIVLEGSYAGSLRDYHEIRSAPAGAEIPAFPYTIVVIDGLSQLLEDDPGFAAVITTLLRKGRSLGMHLLLASEDLGATRLSRVEPHVTYRIALRTNNARESRDIIGTLDAYELPRIPGVGLYCPLSADDPVLFTGFEIPRQVIGDIGSQLATATAN